MGETTQLRFGILLSTRSECKPALRPESAGPLYSSAAWPSPPKRTQLGPSPAHTAACMPSRGRCRDPALPSQSSCPHYKESPPAARPPAAPAASGTTSSSEQAPSRFGSKELSAFPAPAAESETPLATSPAVSSRAAAPEATSTASAPGQLTTAHSYFAQARWRSTCYSSTHQHQQPSPQ